MRCMATMTEVMQRDYCSSVPASGGGKAYGVNDRLGKSFPIQSTQARQFRDYLISSDIKMPGTGRYRVKTLPRCDPSHGSGGHARDSADKGPEKAAEGKKNTSLAINTRKDR
jgi:hypothetical protein